MTEPEMTREETIAKLEAASAELSAMCRRQLAGQHAIQWSIPVRDGIDSDTIIGGAIRAALAALRAETPHAPQPAMTVRMCPPAGAAEQFTGYVLTQPSNVSGNQASLLAGPPQDAAAIDAGREALKLLRDFLAFDAQGYPTTDAWHEAENTWRQAADALLARAEEP